MLLFSDVYCLIFFYGFYLPNKSYISVDDKTDTKL